MAIQIDDTRIVRHNVALDDGRTVQLFVNRDTSLVVLDIIDADEQGGCEVYRHKHDYYERDAEDAQRRADAEEGFDD